jgi:hypothetical protein
VKKLLLAAVVALSACDLASEEYRNGVPTAQHVTMTVPASQGQPLTSTGVTRQGLMGDTAQFYQLTRQVSVFVNGAGVGILNLVQDITNYPATSVDNNVATWGPWTDSLSPNTYKFQVTKNATNDFSYILQGKGKTQDDSSYVTLLSGSHTVSSAGKAFGHGTFLLDMNAAATLPEHDANSAGTAEYTYSHDTADADTNIQATFTQVKDKDSGLLVNAQYNYISNDSTGGSLDFQFQGDIDKATPALEDATLNSRWRHDGSGRSDVKITGGDLAAGTDATANECWDSNFASRYLDISFDPTDSYGDVSACGDMSSALYSELRL